MLTLLTMTLNEEVALPRLLDSAGSLVDHVIVVDTGSTDGTIEIAKKWNAEIYHSPWVNFGINRTEAASYVKDGWILFLDADMTVAAVPNFREWLQNGATANAYHVLLTDGTIRYRLPLLLRAGLDWQWVGAVHEYLDKAGPVQIVNGLFVQHHADGGSRDNKFERDLELLHPLMSTGDPRSTYYYAVSLHCLGRRDEAIEMYLRRAWMTNTFEEERWYAKYQAGKLLLDQGDREGVKHLLDAHNERPWRAEPLNYLSKWAKELCPKAYPVDDLLFIEPDAYL